MGKNATTQREMAYNVSEGTMGALNAAVTFQPLPGCFNAVISGVFVGTAVLERSFDGGTTYVPATRKHDNTAISTTAPTSIVVEEPEEGVIYRWRCSAYTSGTMNARFSK